MNISKSQIQPGLTCYDLSTKYVDVFKDPLPYVHVLILVIPLI